MRAIIYDIEIKKAIPDRNGKRLDGIEYCEGWQDHANMGISVIGCYDYVEDRARVFCDDNMGDFYDLCDSRDLLVGFNNIPFDNAVIDANHGGKIMPEDRCYDILREIWIAAGLPPTFDFKTHGGYGLDAMCERNFGTKKTGSGALAPVDWQQGRIGRVIDYCLNDIMLTKQLLDNIISGHQPLVDPKTGKPLFPRIP
ncbi:hypothetical protein UFOVP1670_72 [uncultured Caudovirales phage]|uniref:Uncharacterized protein n=1 Tax=uncultured Caudovirales phage TaxID=2100421 RepID=A0A6J5T775_9CAUD|nr:hypothetical protein UFOVP1670_72 [uncultured Caudovirales phage]